MDATGSTYFLTACIAGTLAQIATRYKLVALSQNGE